MMTTISLAATMQVTFSGLLTQNSSDATASPITIAQNLGGISQSYSGTSTPTGTLSWSGQVTMVAGTATIDLTSLTQAGLAGTLNANGLKLRVMQAVAPSTNAAAIQLAPSGTNGYAPIGTISAIAGGDMALKTTTQATAVSSTSKTIAITGTGTDALNLFMVFGT